MARYIEKEAAIKAAVGALREVSQITAVEVAQALEDSPLADVVPKSEVKQYNRYYFDAKKADESLNKLIANAKAEVAWEIFEEIEESLSALKIHIHFYDEHFYRKKSVNKIIAKLKKKYTEEK